VAGHGGVGDLDGKRLLTPFPAIAGIFLVLVFSPQSSFSASLIDEAGELRLRAIRSYEAITSLSLTCRKTITYLYDGKEANIPAGYAESYTERILWDRKGRKLRRRPLEGKVVAIVVDRDVVYSQTSSTVSVESIGDDERGYESTPEPVRLWRPDMIIPEKPAAVREEGSALVLVTSSKAPIREVWLDRQTGRLVKYVDDATHGSGPKTVTFLAWKRISGAWIPARIECDWTDWNTPQGKRTVFRLSRLVVNPPVSGDVFMLPGQSRARYLGHGDP
jgi:hypothetical protein